MEESGTAVTGRLLVQTEIGDFPSRKFRFHGNPAAGILLFLKRPPETFINAERPIKDAQGGVARC